VARTSRFVRTPPVEPHVITAEVLRTERLTESMQRVTLTGEGLANFTPVGYDQWFRMFLAREGQDALGLPTSTSALWYAQYLALPRDRRPWVRNYTVRAWRDGSPGRSPELDIDFVIHGDSTGPASGFAVGALPGTTVGLLDQGLGYEPDRTEDWQLLVADESGLPAVAGIVASLPADARAEVYLEVPSDDDRQELGEPAGVSVHWLTRTGAQAKPGELALAEVERMPWPAGSVYAYVVGERALPTGLRHFLVNERGVSKHDITFQGYWRHGHAAT
jgi:NADPH-dependent ferric siderophore reductase